MTARASLETRRIVVVPAGDRPHPLVESDPVPVATHYPRMQSFGPAAAAGTTGVGLVQLGPLAGRPECPSLVQQPTDEQIRGRQPDITEEDCGGFTADLGAGRAIQSLAMGAESVAIVIDAHRSRVVAPSLPPLSLIELRSRLAASPAMGGCRDGDDA